ncbi:MAG: hypothetical protein SVR81_04220 [Chloroflexota bacterium]|nr:hypothetical protein [Chloroflexota bacterium]
MTDQSKLDLKYFIDSKVFNCPFCNRNNVVFKIEDDFEFDWSNSKKCYAFLARCTSCNKISMHLSFEKIVEYHRGGSIAYGGYSFLIKGDEIDKNIFYSVPTSFFVMDNRIPSLIRELITEAEGSLKMNFLTGASACMRKAIYELLVLEETTAEYYEDRIRELKSKYPNIDSVYFEVLASIQEMTSDKIHEQSWDEWNSPNLRLIIETLKTVLNEIYVLPKVREEQTNAIKQLRSKLPKK